MIENLWYRLGGLYRGRSWSRGHVYLEVVLNPYQVGLAATLLFIGQLVLRIQVLWLYVEVILS